MSDAQSWYARKLAAVRGTPIPSPQPRAYQYPQQPQPQQFAPQQPQQQFVQPQQFDQQPGTVTIDNLWDRMQQWRGGKAHRVDSQPCPECGSNNYYSRSEGARRGPPPAPHCFACGYNGLFEQGLPGSWES